jgi:hypothetical protein
MSPQRFDVGELPQEAHARLIHLSNVFGRVPVRHREVSLPQEWGLAT